VNKEESTGRKGTGLRKTLDNHKGKKGSWGEEFAKERFRGIED